VTKPLSGSWRFLVNQERSRLTTDVSPYDIATKARGRLGRSMEFHVNAIVRVCRVVSAGGIAIAASIACSAAQTAPDPATQKGYTSFVATLASLTASASDLIALERGAGRLAIIRQAIATKLVAAYDPGAPAAAKTVNLSDVLDVASLLCGFRANSIKVVDKLSLRDPSATVTVDHLQTVARSNYLSSVVTQIESVSKVTTPGDILSALQALFASYQVKATDASLQATAIDKVRARTLQRCQGDLKEFDKAYYGIQIKAPEPGPVAAEAAAPAAGLPSLSFLGPIGVLVDTVLGIVTPVIIDGATIIDEAKREKAVSDFLSDPKNQTALRTAGTQLARAVSDYTFAKRMSLAGSFAEQTVLVSNIKVELAKIDACNDPEHKVYVRSASGAPSAIFISCYRAVWAQFQDGVNSAIKTGGDYDLIADAGDTSAALISYEKITEDFGAIAQNSITNPAVFWQYVTQLVNFAGAVSTALSQDNRTKLEKAIDAMVKGS
jgi:hypothetical protein